MSTALRVLNVEDSERDVELIQRHLLRAGYEPVSERVETASAMKAELERREFDVILCDYSMPHFNAIKALALLKEMELDIPFIIISGTVGEAAAVEAMRAGANDYLMKDNLVRLAPIIERERHEAENRHARRRAEAALRESEDRYRDLVEHSRDLICTHDLEGRILSVNQEAARLLGYDSETLLGRNILEALLPEFRHEFDDYIAKLLSEGIARGVMVVQTKTGDRRVWEYTNTLRTEGVAAPIVRGVAHDATEQRQAEKALKASEAELRALFVAMTDVIIVLDAHGRHLKIAPTDPAYLYKPKDDMIGRTLHEVFPKEKADFFLEHIARALDEGRMHRVEYSLQINGTEIWFDGSVSPMSKDSVVWIARDITERKRAEAERRLIFEIIQGVITTPNLDELLKLIHHSIGELLYAENCFVALYDQTNDLMYFQFWVDKFYPIPPPGPPGTGFSGYVLRTGQPLLLTEELMNEMYRRGEVEKGGRSSASWLGVPLRTSSRTIGILVLQHYEDEHAYSRGDLEFLSSVGDQIALAIERRRAEDALRETARSKAESLALLDTILSTAPIGFAFHNRDLVFERINKTLAAINGLSVEEHLGRTLREALPETAYGLEPLLRRVLETGDAVIDSELSGEAPADPGQQHYWLASFYPVRMQGGEMLGVGVLVSDITERKRAEEALRQSEERYRLLFERNPQPMWVFDLETLAFLEVNEAAIKHYGYSREEFLAMTITDIRPTVDVPPLIGGMSEEPTEHSEAGIWKHTRKDGSIIDVEITGHALTFYGRRARIVLSYDVTERISLEEQFRQAQKMEAIGQLAGGIAHDFNNLLTAINGYCELTIRRLRHQDPLLPNLEEIKKAGDRAASLTRQLLAFSRKQVLQPRILDLNSVVSDLEKMLRRLIGEDVELRTVLDPTLGRIKVDPGQVEQIIMNLAVNARDAMPQGGKLTIETKSVYLDGDYARKHIGASLGYFVMLAVSDNGEGMDLRTQARIFEPFYTTKEVGKGTGLGLSTVYGIVKQSGGDIWVYSEVGRGTTFKVYLPRIDEDVQEYKKSIKRGEDLRGQETILIAEDEEIVRKLTCQVLGLYGYQVLEAANGGTALLICERRTEPIHLLITDMVMPEMSGRELSERLSKLRPEMKVLYMSGYTDSAMLHQGALEDGENFIQKPFSPDTLATKVREVLDAPKLSR